MKSTKVQAGSMFPEIVAHSLDGKEVEIGSPTGGADWMMVVVYRGRHCPLCTKYLNKLEDYR